MIVFDLECRPVGHRFEGWFGSSDDYVRQQERGLVTCPTCGSAEVGKAVMAPNVGRKSNQAVVVRPSAHAPAEAAPDTAAVTNAAPQLPPEAMAMLHAIAEKQAEALKKSRWVGKGFAKTARAIHYGETEPELVHGQASPKETQELMEEGVGIAPVLFPIVPPGEAN